jgi:hypothetical protein
VVRRLPPLLWHLPGVSRPAPDPVGSALAVHVNCESSGAGGHELVLESDWSATVPHDLEAERVLVALGGSSGCVDLVDRIVPVARMWLELHLRAGLPALAAGRLTLPSPAGDCCRDLRNRTWRDGSPPLREVVAHIRSVRHLATVCGVNLANLSAVTTALAAAYRFEHENLLDLDRAVAVAHCVKPTEAVAHLWSIGLSPWAIASIHTASRRSTAATPTDVFEQVLLRSPRATELVESLQDRTRSSEDLYPSDDWLRRFEPDAPGQGEWSSTGLPWNFVVALSQGGYEANDVRALAAAGRGTLAGAARTLAKWAKAGCRPPVDVLLRFRELGLDHNYEHVSGAVVQRLDDLLSEDGVKLSPTHRGLLFTAAGSAVEARSWVRAGVIDPFEIAERASRGEVPELSEVGSKQLQ